VTYAIRTATQGFILAGMLCKLMGWTRLSPAPGLSGPISTSPAAMPQEVNQSAAAFVSVWTLLDQAKPGRSSAPREGDIDAPCATRKTCQSD
jgi:hypothetical protein